MSRYQGSWRRRYARKWEDGPVEPTQEKAEEHVPANISAGTLLRDQEGKDHPANAGKFFLYRILK